MIKIKSGGQTESLKGKKIESISFYSERELSIGMTLNEDSLSYLTIEEAVKLRNELNKALENAIGL